MSLKITNKATAKQKAILQKLEYNGTGQFALDQLTVEDAASLIDELFAEKSLENDWTYGDMPDEMKEGY